MVSTRNHPSSFPPPDLTPTKPTARPAARITNSPNSPSNTTNKPGPWIHIPNLTTLLWLLASLPVVLWDTSYVLLRPHSMPGGALHAPVFSPYALYGSVDYIYGEKAYRERNGFTAAQAGVNLVECAGYVGYLWVVWRFGVEGKGTGRRVVGVGGGWGGLACLVGFALSVMTFSKTLLYMFNEFFSGFDNVGHNDALSLLFLWIVPNGLWIVFPSYMIYLFGRDILHGLSIASGDRTSKPARVVTPIKEE